MREVGWARFRAVRCCGVWFGCVFRLCGIVAPIGCRSAAPIGYWSVVLFGVGLLLSVAVMYPRANAVSRLAAVYMYR